MTQQRAKRVEEQIVDRGRAPGDEQLRDLQERSQPTRDEDRRAEPETQHAECSAEGHEQQGVSPDVPEEVRRRLRRTMVDVNERYELKLVFRSWCRREGDREDGTDRARQRNTFSDLRPRRIAGVSSENREPERSKRYDAEQQSTDRLRPEEVAGRAATEYDEGKRAEVDHITPRVAPEPLRGSAARRPIDRRQNGLAPRTNAQAPQDRRFLNVEPPRLPSV